MTRPSNNPDGRPTSVGTERAEVVSARLDPEQIAQIAELEESLGVSRSEVVRSVIEAGIRVVRRRQPRRP